MASHLTRTNLILETCKDFLVSQPDCDPQIQSFLAQHLLVVLCSDIEQCIQQFLSERGQVSGDIPLSKFVYAASKRIMRSVDKKDLAKVLEMFGEEFKEKLNTLVDDQDVSYYGIAVKNRHTVAHSSGTNVTFSDIVNSINSAERILEAFRESLGLPAANQTSVVV